MVTVKVEFLSWLAETISNDDSGEPQFFEMHFENETTVKDLLWQLGLKYPTFASLAFDRKLSKLAENICIFYNGRPIELENGLETPIKEGDSLVFLPMLQGG